MFEAARRLGVEVWTPESVNLAESQARLAEYGADLLVVCDYGEILQPETLAAARLGGVNLHASLLPKYRGAAPINWAIYHGEAETGVSVIQMTAGLDAGPCLAQVATPIRADETAIELERRLAELGAEAVCRTVDALVAGGAEPIPQNPQQATKAPRLKKSDGAIDWSRSAEQICNQVRSLQPWPGSYTFWRGAGRPLLRLILSEVAVCENHENPIAGGTTATDGAGSQRQTTCDVASNPGEILISERRLVVATGAGAVEIHRLQPAGKRVLAADAFLRGTPIQPGERFFSPE